MDSNLQYRAVKGRFIPSASGSSRFVGPRKSLFSDSGGRDQLSEPQRSAMASSCYVAMEVGSAGLGGCESNPEVSLSRRLPAVCSGYLGHALDAFGFVATSTVWANEAAWGMRGSERGRLQPARRGY
jgi:hypothetical protein